MGSMRRRIKDVAAVVEREWDDFTVETTPRGHLRVILRRGAASRFVVTPATPGDWRSLMSFRRDVRREAAILRELSA